MTFILSAPSKKQWPDDDVKEICFLGKSNVGKSSLLNALTNNKKMARVSSTPGCTKLINFFDVDNKFRLVDAPGYGYHKNSMEADRLFSKMMNEYIKERKNVEAFVLLVDSRHKLSDDDIDCFNMLIEANKEIIVVATKADKLNQKMKNEYKKNIVDVFKDVGDIKIFLTSSLDKSNIEELVNYINSLMCS
ncbi:MAG: ribosome biogenesis GTP-binding protein YsxC [Bacilli bacterium]|nr:ribosome biogenesis GTP-binding protein YsxC [Bacilli bacterium]